MKVCIGGTFNVLHKGHKKLFEKGIQLAGENGRFFIGVTRGVIPRKKKYYKPIEERIDNIWNYLKNKGYDKIATVTPIKDRFGLATDGDYDIIIVSPETKQNAIDINKVREKKGKNPLKIVEIPYVLAADNKPISSTRILDREIDENGELIK